MPAMTKEEAMKRFLEVLKTDQPNKGPGPEHNWPGVFKDWLSYNGQIKKFCLSKDIHPGTLQRRGGRTLWIQLREAVRKEGLAHAIEKMPEVWSKKYELQARAVCEGTELVRKMFQNLDNIIQTGKKKDKEFIENKLKTVAEALSLLNDTNIQLNNDGVQKIEAKSLNLHGTMMEAMKTRDQQYGIKD